MAASVVPLLLLVTASPPALVTDLRDLIHVIARTYFTNFRCIVYLTDYPDDIAMMPDHRPAMIFRPGNATLLRSAYDDSCPGFIVRTSAERRLGAVRDLVLAYKQSQHARYNDKRYLFLPVSARDTNASFLESREMYYTPNLIFVSPADNSTYELVTHNFFHGHKYDVLGVKHEVVDVWTPWRGFEQGVDLYPDRIRNLNGKLLRFSLLNYSPYAFVLNGSDGQTVYDGLETKVAAQFVQASNGTWTGLDNPVYLWGELFGNGSGTGVFGTVLENKADLGFSAIYQWYCDVLECSRPYIHSDVTCLVPKPEVVSGYLTIILPFQSEAWFAFITCFIFSGLFIFFVQVTWKWIRGIRDQPRIRSNLFEAFYNVFRFQLEQTPRSASSRTPMSDYYKIWGVYTFLIAVCWQGGISSFLTVPRYDAPINDARDLAARFPRVRWGANHIAWVESIKESTDPVLVKIVKEFVVADAETLKSHASKKDFAYFMETLQFEHYALNTYIDEEGMRHLRIMEKNVYGGYVVIILTRGSPYQKRLDEILLLLFETGLVLKTGTQVVLDRIDIKLQNMVRSSVEKPMEVPTTLRVTHIQGALYIYALGIAISVAAFCTEVRCFFTTRIR